MHYVKREGAYHASFNQADERQKGEALNMASTSAKQPLKTMPATPLRPVRRHTAAVPPPLALTSRASKNKDSSSISSCATASQVYVSLFHGGIADDPDARLRTFENVSHQLSQPYSQCDHGESEGRWAWATVVLCGVMDPWSRIRHLAIPVMVQLFMEEVERRMRCAVVVDMATPRTNTSSSSRRQTPRKRHSEGALALVRQDRLANAALLRRDTRAALLPTLHHVLHTLYVRWARASAWYEQEGLLRLFGRVLNTPSFTALRCDEAWLRRLFFDVVFPSLRNAQLPVREAAARILGDLFTPRDINAPPAIASFVLDYVLSTLRGVARSTTHKSPLLPSDEARTRVLEGYLLALLSLTEAGVSIKAAKGVVELVLHLADYPASSVRQYVAEVLRPPSEATFALLFVSLCEWKYDPSSLQDVTNSWQRRETILMALQQHLIFQLTPPKGKETSEHGGAQVIPPTLLDRLPTALAVVFAAAQHPRFEVARMGTQLFPLLLQLCVRFAPVRLLGTICRACCMLLSTTASCTQTPQAASSMQQMMATVVLPSLWWFLLLRQLGAPSREVYSVVADVVRPSLSLETLRAALDSLDGAEVPLVPLITGAAIPMVTYFSPITPAGDWVLLCQAALDLDGWQGLLANRQWRELLRFGPDLVRAVRLNGDCSREQLLRLVPLWVSALWEAQTHQQCALITMVRLVLLPHAELLTAEHGQQHQLLEPFGFVYHDSYTAPAMLDGGEEVPLGYSWLKELFTSPEAVPIRWLWTLNPSTGTRGDGGGGAHSPSASRRCDIVIRDVIFRQLYVSPNTELSVLREVQALMMCLCNNSREDDTEIGTTSHRLAWYAVTLAAIFARLASVCPSWADASTVPNSPEKSESDWDASDAGGDGWDASDASATYGVSAMEERRFAAVAVGALRECASQWSEPRRVAEIELQYRVQFSALHVKNV